MVKVKRLPEPFHPPYYDVLLSSAVSAYMLTLLDDTTAAAARATLGLGSVTFSGYSTAAATAGQYLTSFTMLHNVGSHFNATTGLFTAPVTGLYRFNFGAINQAAGGNLRMRFAKNSVEIQPSAFTAGANQSISAGTEIRLTAGDFVGVFIPLGTILTDAGNFGYNHFSGTLVA